MIDLSQFCLSDDHGERRKIDVPWSVGDWTYAANGHIGIRVPRRSDVPERKGTPDLQKVLDQYFSEAGLVTAPVVRKWPRVKAEDCAACGGSGECPCCERECLTCEGEGKVEGRASVALSGSVIDLRYARMMWALPGLRVPVNGPNCDQLSFAADDGVIGLVMTVRGQFSQHHPDLIPMIVAEAA